MQIEWKDQWRGAIVCCGLIFCVLTASARATGLVDLPDRPAIAVSAAARAVFLDITAAGQRLIAVGERGVVVLSDDGGQTWRQAQVPTSVSLTGVAFPTPKQGWAIGHAGIVLHTEDGGETWTKQLDGVVAARLALEAAEANAQRVGPDDEEAQRHLEAAQYLVDDGPDKPFLDLAFEDEQHGFVVGAYNLIFRTDDGGRTWQPWLDRVDNPMGLHFYAIQIVGSSVYLAGEQGLFLRSTDAGEHFERRETPYEGTYFAVMGNEQGELLLAGLRGNAYWSADGGETFQLSQVPIPVSFSAIARDGGGTLYFANQAGLLLVSHDGGRTLIPLNAPHLPPLASLMAAGPDHLLTVGWGGVIPVPLGTAGAAGGTR
ncbi:MAG: YCF48-related protein [Deferrisomatales bacterium]|nr:YCF48-related protein [Deferrisomatales bacterium]